MAAAHDFNPFALGGGRSGAAPAASDGASAGRRVLSAEERTESLQGHRLVPAKYWQYLPFGRHVRYFFKDDTSSAGLVVSGQYTSAEGLLYISLRTTPPSVGVSKQSRRTFWWKVAHADLASVYLRQTADELMTADDIRGVADSVSNTLRKLAGAIHALAVRMDKSGT